MSFSSDFIDSLFETEYEYIVFLINISSAVKLVKHSTGTVLHNTLVIVELYFHYI